MLKRIKYILIPAIAFAILFAPISSVFEKGELSKIETNKALASSCEFNITTKVTNIASDGMSIQTLLEIPNPASDNSKDGKIDTTGAVSDTLNAYWGTITSATLNIVTLGLMQDSVSCLMSTVELNSEANAWSSVLKSSVSKNTEDKFLLPNDRLVLWVSTSKDFEPSLTLERKIDNIDITANRQTLNLTFNKNQLSLTNQTTQDIIKNSKTLYFKYKLKTISTQYSDIETPTSEVNLKTDSSTIGSTSQDISNVEKDFDFSCGITNLKGCFAQIFYVFWEIAAYIARLAGGFLDFFVYYSTDSASYTSAFVTKSWGAVRDIANIFFIIALLYIAIKTILSLNTTDNKKLISYIVIIALLINFSLFFTQVIIDGSNILAKVFYNNITSVDTNGKIQTGEAGEKSISVGMVDKFNPQALVTTDYYAANTGTFIFIIILSTVVMLYAAWIFFTVALLFVGRVVALWISMIFSPIAFASYTVPFDIPGMGHKEWWSELMKNAFLAPIFIFFLYIIVLFLDVGIKLTYGGDTIDTSTTQGIMANVMHVTIPFIILYILLMKAKAMAVKMSGEMGQAIISAGKMIGGAAVGLAAGGLAFAGRRAIGGLGSAMANSERVNKWADSDNWLTRKAGLGLKGAGKFAEKGSFDVRGIKIAGKSLASTGLQVNTLGGKVRTGGFAQMREEKIAKRQRRADAREMGAYEKPQRDLRQTQSNLKILENKTHGKIEDEEKQIEIKNKKLNEANKSGNTEEAKKLGEELKGHHETIRLIKEGVTVVETEKEKVITREELEAKASEISKGPDAGVTPEENWEKAKKALGGDIGSTVKVKVKEEKPDNTYRIKDAKGEMVSMSELTKSIKEQTRSIAHKNQHRRELYIKDITTKLQKNIDVLTAYGRFGNQESENRIRMEIKGAPKPTSGHSDSGSHGGGSHGGGGHAPKADHKESHDSHAKGGDSHGGGGHAPKADHKESHDSHAKGGDSHGHH